MPRILPISYAACLASLCFVHGASAQTPPPSAAPNAPSATPRPKGPEPAAAGAETGAPKSWSDASVHISWGPTYAEPGVTTADGQGAKIAKTTVSLVYVSGDRLGGNFAEIDYLQSAGIDPAANSHAGATEFYLIMRRDFSFNKLTHTKKFSFAFIRDIGIEAGADLETKDTAFAPSKKFFLLGPTISIDLPGVWNIGVYADKEWNHNGLSSDLGRSSTGGTVNFKPTLNVASAWSVPIGKLPFLLEGIAEVNLPKGKDGFGDQTKTEVLVQPKLFWDVSSLCSEKLKGYLIGVGYQFWWNKFGNDHTAVPGSVANTVFAEAAVHF